MREHEQNVRYVVGGDQRTSGILSDKETIKERTPGAIRIVRLAPSDGAVSFQVQQSLAGCRVIAEVLALDGQVVSEQNLRGESGHFEELSNGVDRYLRVSLLGEKGNVLESDARLFRSGFIPGTVVNYLHPDDYTFASSGRSLASPSLLNWGRNTLLASHDVYWPDAGQNLTQK